MTEEQYQRLEESQKKYVRELMMANSLSKDSEVSGLHSQILQEIKTIKESVNNLTGKIESHDEVIKKVEAVLPDAYKALEAYKTTNIAGKLIIGLVLGVPALATFVAGILYLTHLGDIGGK